MPFDPDVFGNVQSPLGSLSSRHRDMNANLETDEDGATIVTFSDISAAAFRIVNAVQRTPCIVSHLSEMFDMKLHFKMEQMQVQATVRRNRVVLRRFVIIHFPTSA